MRHKKTKRIKNKKRTKNFKKYGGYGLKTKSKKHKHKHSNKHTNSIKFVKLNCSPENHNKALNSFTCYSDEDYRRHFKYSPGCKQLYANDSKIK